MRAKSIYHMLPLAEWQAHLSKPAANAEYRPDSLVEEGFIHCTGERERLAAVANQYYRNITEPFVVLEIDAARVESTVRWEAADGHLFPHIYGPLTRDAVVAVAPFPRADDGEFLPFTTEDEGTTFP